MLIWWKCKMAKTKKKTSIQWHTWFRHFRCITKRTQKLFAKGLSHLICKIRQNGSKLLRPYCKVFFPISLATTKPRLRVALKNTQNECWSDTVGGWKIAYVKMGNLFLNTGSRKKKSIYKRNAIHDIHWNSTTPKYFLYKWVKRYPNRCAYAL